MSVGLGEEIAWGMYTCNDGHQQINYFWNVKTGYECPLCNIVDHEEYADEQNEKLINELEELSTRHKKLQYRSKEIINYMKEKEQQEEYFDEDVTETEESENG